jgi:hypothetical protein
MREPPGNLRKASVMFQVNMGAVKTKKSTNQSILFQTLQGENTEVSDAILHFACRIKALQVGVGVLLFNHHKLRLLAYY